MRFAVSLVNISVLGILLFVAGCKSKEFPCPDPSEADNVHEWSSKLKKKEKFKDNGLVRKKKPKQLSR